MVGVLILTHGNLAIELLASARVIAGELENFEALPLAWDDGIEEAQAKVSEVLERLDCNGGVLILTDIFGGTPSNVAMAFRDPGHIEVVSGVNLPMVVRLGCLKTASMPIADLAAWIRDKAQTSICCSGELPRANGSGARRVGARSTNAANAGAALAQPATGGAPPEDCEEHRQASSAAASDRQEGRRPPSGRPDP